jgi:uncharacterized protein
VFRKKRRWPKIASAVFGAFSVFGLYGFWYEPSGLRAVRYPILMDTARRISREPLRIAVISDLHAGSPYIGEAKIDRVVGLANAANPDLILLTGDYVIRNVIGGRYMPIETVTAHLKGLRAPLGVFAVLGNHDRRIGAAHSAKVFEAAGIPVLDDKKVVLARDGEEIMLAGISDFRTGPHDMTAALAGILPEAHAICFTHSPDIFPVLPRTCALTIAGHTHGGQVSIPFIGRPMVPSRYRQRYAAGLVHEGEKYLFVSTGIGTSIIPVRIGVPPEVSILEIGTGE